MVTGVDSTAVEPTGSSPADALLGEGDATDRVSRRVAWLVLTLSTLVAAALRFPFLGHESLWLDEIFTREILAEPTLSGVWHHVQQTESTPPLYYVVGWLVGARSAESMRVISALALTAAVPVSYLAFRRLVGQRAALAVAAILAVSPMLVSYATDARSYGLFVLSGLLTIWGFAAVLERPTFVRYALWALGCVACIWTHYFGGYLVAAEAVILLWQLRERRLATLGWLLAIGVLVSPLIPLVAHQAGSERAAWIEAESLSSRVTTTIRQFAMGPNVPRTWLEGIGLAVWYLAVGFGTVVAICRRRGAWLIVILAAISIGVPLFTGIIGAEDRFSARNVMVAVPLVAALAAPTMLRMRAMPLVVYLTLALVASVWVATNWRYEQADWRDAIARIEAADPRVPVIAITQSSVPVVRTYLEREAAGPAGLVTDATWIVVEPTRGPHDRALVAGAAPAIAGFTTVRELSINAFRLILVHSNQPMHISSGMVPYATVFPAR